MSDQQPIRVLSADDHALLREGIAAVINGQPDMTMIAQASSGREAIQLFREHRPDVTLMDLRMPDISGIDALIAILGEFPNARIVMLTTFEGDVEIQRALSAGARGYLLKNMPPKELVEAIRQVHAGRKRIPGEIAAQLAEHITDERLTEREIDVLQHVAGGNRNRDIAEQLAHFRGNGQGPRQAHHGEARAPAIARPPWRLRSGAGSSSYNQIVVGADSNREGFARNSGAIPSSGCSVISRRSPGAGLASVCCCCASSWGAPHRYRASSIWRGRSNPTR